MRIIGIFSENNGIAVFTYVYVVMMDVGASQRIVDIKDVSVVIVTHVMPDYQIPIFFRSTDPGQSMGIVMAVTVLPYGARAAQVGIIHAAVVIYRFVGKAFIELEYRISGTPGKHGIAGNPTCGFITEVMLHNPSFRQPNDHGVFGDMMNHVVSYHQIGEFSVVPFIGSRIVGMLYLIVGDYTLVLHIVNLAAFNAHIIKSRRLLIITNHGNINPRSLFGFQIVAHFSRNVMDGKVS